MIPLLIGGVLRHTPPAPPAHSAGVDPAPCAACRGLRIADESEREHPSRTARRQVDAPPLRDEAREPRQQAQAPRDRGRQRARGRRGRGVARRARLRRERLLLPGQPAPRALDRGAGRHQRGQELPERRRLGVPAVLRHGQGRRLPRARGQRLPPGRGLGRDHRPVRGAGRAVRARVRRDPRQPLVRRRPGLAHVLRARPDRPAAAARRLPGADAADRARPGQAVPAPRDARARGGGRARARHRHARHGHGRARDAPRGRGRARDRRLRQRLLPLDQREGLQRHRDLARLQEGRRLREPLLHADPPDLHPGPRRLPEQAHADERVAPQRRAHLGAEAPERHAAAARDPRGRARLLPGAQVPELRQPRPARRRLARRQAGVRRRPRRGPRGPRRLPRLQGRDRAARCFEDRREVRQPLRDVRAHHRRGPLQGADAHLPGLALHHGRAVGGLQPDEHDPRPARGRRGQLLRPRRQPPRRLRAHAGPGRRLLRPALHHRPLPRVEQAREARRLPPRGARGARGGRGAHPPAARRQGPAHRDAVPPRARPADVGALRHGAQQARARDGTRADPGAARGVLEERERPRQRRRAQPVAREGRPRGRLPRVRRAHVPGRARARGVLRRALPRGVPDARGRGTARRRPLLPRGGVGVEGGSGAARAPREPLAFENVPLQTRSYK